MMKKEKLEQMRELGRGGLTKGLSMLRSAASQAAERAADATASQQQQANAAAAASSTTPLSALDESTGDAQTAPSAPTNKLSYDELVALSMKLTRQNKLMKAQFHKMTTRIAALSASEADAAVLTDFVTRVVGVDVEACHVSVDDASADRKDSGECVATIDATALAERYVLNRKLTEREHRRVEAQLREQKGDSVPPPEQLRNYDEIDLLSEPPAPPPVEAPPTQLSAEAVADLETRLAGVSAELEQLRGALDDERATLQRALAANEASEAAWQARWDAQLRLTADAEPTPVDEDGNTEPTPVDEDGNTEPTPVDEDGNTEPTPSQNEDVNAVVASLQLELAAAQAALVASQGDASEQSRSSDADLSSVLSELEKVKMAQAELEHKLRTAEQQHKAAHADATALRDANDALTEELAVLRSDTQANLEAALAEAAATREQASERERRTAEERTYLEAKLEALIRELDSAHKEREAVERAVAEKDKQVAKMASSQTAMTAELMALQQQLGAMQNDLHLAAEGLEVHAERAEQSERLRYESDAKLATLTRQLDAFQREKDAAVEQVRALESAHSDDKRRVADLEAVTAQQTTAIGNLSVDLAETKKALSDRMGLATRLQTENMGLAAKQAEQAALIESALREAAAGREATETMRREVQDAHAALARTQQTKDDAVAEMQALQRDVAQERAELEAANARAAADFDAAMATEREACRRDVERVEAESKHKSKLALQAVLAKEAEIAQLASRLAELEEDVRSGDADHRKIFEVAQLQAKREAEARAQTQQLVEMAARLDDAARQIQQLQEEKQRHDGELTALMQTQRREGVNMEYLKNVVVQYMSFRPGSSQQARLVPVLSTLLQFSTRDVKEIKSASSARRSSWTSWGGTDTKDYKSILDNGKGQRHPMLSPASSSSSSSFTLAPAIASASSDPSAFASHATSESADF